MAYSRGQRMAMLTEKIARLEKAGLLLKRDGRCESPRFQGKLRRLKENLRRYKEELNSLLLSHLW